MTGTLSIVLSVAALLLAAFAGLWAALDRPMSARMLLAAVLVEAVALAQVVVAVIDVVGAQRTGSNVALILGYLAALAVLLPIGAVAGWVEPSRWGSVALATAAVFVPVLVVRLHQLWSLHGR